MTRTVSRSQLLLARLVIALIVVFAIVGLIVFGFSAEVRARMWYNLVGRQDGPMIFRYFLQPTMSAIAAWGGALVDVRTGRSPFLWGAITDAAERRTRFDEALVDTSRIILLGLVMDIIYQAIVFRMFFPGEAVIFALALAFVPYVILRGLFARGMRWWAGRQKDLGLMSTDQAGGDAPRFEVRVTSDSHFAWVRTRLAVERTMMAYMRTSISLIAFGFTIFHFIQGVHEVRTNDVSFPYAAWWLGLSLIMCGVFASVFALWEYRRQINYLWSSTYGPIAGEHPEPAFTSLYAITSLLIVIGLFAFFAVLHSVPTSLPWGGG